MYHSWRIIFGLDLFGVKHCCTCSALICRLSQEYPNTFPHENLPWGSWGLQDNLFSWLSYWELWWFTLQRLDKYKETNICTLHLCFGHFGLEQSFPPCLCGCSFDITTCIWTDEWLNFYVYLQFIYPKQSSVCCLVRAGWWFHYRWRALRRDGKETGTVPVQKLRHLQWIREEHDWCPPQI